MNKYDQNRTPLFDALRRYVEDGTISFHVPGHKGGNGIPELRDYIGKMVLSIDVNGMEDLDNICNPISVIRESQELAARAFGADQAYYLVNGTTSGVQAMIMTVCGPGDKIIIPRNAHKSAIGGLILSGAQPIYIQPEINYQSGMAMGITPERVKKAFKEHPDAKGILVLNPTYYGVFSDLKQIVEIAHSLGKPVLVDEAHGGPLSFHPELPVSAMEAGADMSAVSTHKLLGSMTQSSLLLVKEGLIDPKKVKGVLNLTQTTSASYVLLVSIELARKQMALKGKELLDEVLALAKWAREELNRVDGLYVFGEDIKGQPGCFDIDPTKIAINVRNLGISGYEAERLLRKKYRIQTELSDLFNTLALITIGDTRERVERLVYSMKEIADRCKIKNVLKYSMNLPAPPEMLVSPREAFYSEKKSVLLEEAEGEISAEMIMAYPPGIPLICPGERITREVIDYVKILKKEPCQLQGTEDPEINYIKVLSRHLVLVRSDSDTGDWEGIRTARPAAPSF